MRAAGIMNAEGPDILYNNVSLVEAKNQKA